MKHSTLFVLALVATGLGGCSPSASSAHGGASAPEAASGGGGGGGREEIARLHRSRCGACHVRVEPGERTRTAIDAALPRHKKRVSLSDAQWAAMAEYLAPTATAALRAPDAKDETTPRQ